MRKASKLALLAGALALAASMGTLSCSGSKDGQAAKESVTEATKAAVTVKAVTENAYFPLNFLDTKTKQGVGLEYDVINEIGSRLGWKVEWGVLAWDAMITSVHEGQYDIGADGISITDDRKKQVDFSDPFLNNQQFLLVRKGENRFKTPEEFKKDAKLLVGAQSGTTGFYVAKDSLLDGNEKNPRIKLYDTFGASVQALMTGDVDVVLVDSASGKGYVSANPDKLEIVGDPIGSDELGFIFTPGSALLKPFNEQLAAIKADGTLDKLVSKWFYEYNAGK
jgi:polar amino acid transport system substrate-binding protein